MHLFFLILIAIIAVSTASIFIKLCDAPALIIAAYRMGLVSLLLLPYASHKRIWKGWKRQDTLWLILSGLFLGFHFAFWIASLKYTSVASSVVLVTPSHLRGSRGQSLLKEHLRRNLVLGLILSVLGKRFDRVWRSDHLEDGIDGEMLWPFWVQFQYRYLLVGR
jgi:drug/metabolite transporter (DMT)-like permease